MTTQQRRGEEDATTWVLHHRSLSPAVDDYTKVIDTLERESEGAVMTSAIAARLAVRPASVSGMLRKLNDLGYLEYLPYRGVRLSEAGREHARGVIRRHRLIELFLFETLGISWDKVHDEAEQLEHAVSPELCELIAARLGAPDYDPHGDPIPRIDGSMRLRQLGRLSEVGPIEGVRVARVSDRDSGYLRNLSSHGIAIGTVLDVLVRDSDGVTVVVEGHNDRLPMSVAASVFVEDRVVPPRFAAPIQG